MIKNDFLGRYFNIGVIICFNLKKKKIIVILKIGALAMVIYCSNRAQKIVCTVTSLNTT